MPIYEYACPKCGEFEATQKISDAPLTHCPTCRRKVTKLISSTSFHLKGSGWYATDYARNRSGAPAKKAEGAATEPAKAEGKASASSEGKKSDAASKTATA